MPPVGAGQVEEAIVGNIAAVAEQIGDNPPAPAALPDLSCWTAAWYSAWDGAASSW